MGLSKRMRVSLVIGAPLVVALAVALVAGFMVSGAHASPTCTQTGYVRDAINLTAAQINPTGTVKGDVNATGCNIGVYYSAGHTGTVNGAEIHGANYYGVVNHGGSVTVKNSNIHDIGETPFNGTQHGVGIYWVFNSASTGTISNNHVWNYQKGGIVVNGTGSPVMVSGNTVTGQGPIPYIAQNGIQIGYGAQAQVMNNTVTGNSYSGGNYASDGGILVVGGPCYGGDYTSGTQIVGNTVKDNDVGVYLSNLADDCVSPPPTATNIKVVNNTISDDAVTNTTGDGTFGYQAGVSDVGVNDKIINNDISGVGYTPVVSDMPYLRFIDADPTSYSPQVKVHANSTP